MSRSDPPRPLRVFVSYSHDSPAHMDRVLALCDRLRHDGVDADLDQYEEAPPEGWPRWTMRQVETADVVLVVCTETYRRRFDGKEEKGRGLGAIWEGAVLTQILYDSAASSGKLVPVLFGQEDAIYIPTILRGVTHYDVSSDTGYEQLYRYLTDQPAVPRPELGPALSLPPKPRTSAFPPVSTAARRKRWPWITAVIFALGLALIGSHTLAPPPKDPEPSIPETPPLQLLKGQILDAKDKRPLPGVLVRLPELKLEQPTDRNGQYRFEIAVPAGAQVMLVATLEGYQPINADPSTGPGLNVHRMWKSS